MELFANLILAAGAIGAGLYCYVLSRRLRDFAKLDQGMGDAISQLSRQVDQLNASLRDAKSTAERANRTVSAQTARAEDAAHRLELLLASMHDLELHSEGDRQ